MEKISLKNYLENKDLLELTYTPYEDKMKIIDLIMDGCIVETTDGLVKIDSVVLERVSTEMFLSSITNIDMEESLENGLTVYDELCRVGEINNLIDRCGLEYKLFSDILYLRKKDFDKTNESIYTVINFIFEQLNGMFSDSKQLLSELKNKQNLSELIK